MGCERDEAARRSSEVLPKRFAKDGLEINTEKTKGVRCGRPQRSAADRQAGTFRCLGFVPYWGKTGRGSPTIQRQTEGKRLRRSRGAFWRWCRDHRHRPLQEQYTLRCAKLRGYSQYDGIRCNSPCLDLVYYAATRAWRYWRTRRGGRQMTWRALGRMRAADPLSRPKSVKGWVECRGGPQERRATGISCAGVRTETDAAGCPRSRATSPYGNVRCRGTV
jgi:RNA-directed DNA polymerase